MQNKFFFLNCILFLSTSLLIPLEASEASTKVFKVGVAFAFLDQFNRANLDSNMHGIEVAKSVFEERNKNIKIKLEKYAHDRSLESVALVAKEIVKRKDEILAVIGPQKSAEVVALGDILKSTGMILISPTATNPEISKDRPNVFSSSYSDSELSKKLAEFTLQKLKPDVLGIIRQRSLNYTNYLASEFRQNIEKLALEKSNGMMRLQVIEKSILDGETDYAGLITEFKKNHVDHVALFVHSSDFDRFVFQATAAEFFPIYIGSDGWGPNERVLHDVIHRRDSGHRFVGYRTTYWGPSDTSAESRLFSKKFRALFKVEPDEWSAVSYDAAMAVFIALAKCKNQNDRMEFRKNILALKFPGVTAKSFQFGINNFPIKGFSVYRLDSKGAKFYGSI